MATSNMRVMTAADVVELVQLLRAHGIDLVIDGGWGVDALLGRETRPHADLDVAISQDDVTILRRVLGERGWSLEAAASGAQTESNFVLVDAAGRRLDVHVWPGVPYPPESLCGTGTIIDVPVRCISAEWAVKFHCQYQPDEDDYRDVSALCSRFGIPLPELYARFRG